jgi:hypothetical protein
VSDKLQPKQVVRITAPVKRVEGKFAVVKLEEGHTVVWPMGLLPPGVTKGEELVITVERRG